METVSKSGDLEARGETCDDTEKKVGYWYPRYDAGATTKENGRELSV